MEEELRNIFALADQDCSGFIDANELLALGKAVNPSFTRQKCHEACTHARTHAPARMYARTHAMHTTQRKAYNATQRHTTQGNATQPTQRTQRTPTARSAAQRSARTHGMQRNTRMHAADQPDGHKLRWQGVA